MDGGLRHFAECRREGTGCFGARCRAVPVSGEVNLLWAEAGMVRQVCYNMHK